MQRTSVHFDQVSQRFQIGFDLWEKHRVLSSTHGVLPLACDDLKALSLAGASPLRFDSHFGPVAFAQFLNYHQDDFLGFCEVQTMQINSLEILPSSDLHHYSDRFLLQSIDFLAVHVPSIIQRHDFAVVVLVVVLSGLHGVLAVYTDLFLDFFA